MSFFFSISDCLNLVNINKKIRNCIVTQHKSFILFKKLKTNNILTYQNIFRQFSDYSDKIKNSNLVDMMLDSIIGDALDDTEKELLLQNFLCSITKVNRIIYSEGIMTNISSKYYLKLLLSFSKCPITQLKIQYFNNTDHMELKDILGSNISITSLTIDEVELTEECVTYLKALEENRTIKKLCIRLKTSNKGDRFSQFLDIIKRHFSIEELELEKLLIDERKSEFISEFLKSNKTIKSFNLVNCIISSGVYDIFKDSFIENNKLESLKLSIKLDPKIIVKLVKDLRFPRFFKNGNMVLPDASNIKHISFANSNLCSEALLLALQIPALNSNIVSFDLTYATIPFGIVDSIISLIKIKNLKKINLTNTGLTEEGFREIWSHLKVNNNLESINFSSDNSHMLNYQKIGNSKRRFSNNLSFPDKMIHELFEENKTLKEFITTGNPISKKIGDYIYETMLSRQIKSE